MRVPTALLLLPLIVGCAATKSSTTDRPLSLRVTQIEQTLDRQDQNINEIKYDIKELVTRFEDLEMYAMPGSIENYEEPEETKSSPSKKLTKEKDIIRVSMGPQEIQQALKNAGYYNGPIDGKIGRKSQKAIGKFQKDHDLSVDGIVGKKTWEELKNYVE